MAKGIRVKSFDGIKIRTYKNVAIRVTDQKGNHYIVRFPWDIWLKLSKEINTPVIEHVMKTIEDFDV